MPEDEMKSERDKEKDAGRRKKPYAPPRLTVHGDVEELTKFMRLVVFKGADATVGFFYADD